MLLHFVLTYGLIWLGIFIFSINHFLRIVAELYTCQPLKPESAQCNRVLQTGKDLFEPEIQQISPNIATLRPFFSLQNPQKLLDIP